MFYGHSDNTIKVIVRKVSNRAAQKHLSSGILKPTSLGTSRAGKPVKSPESGIRKLCEIM